MAHDGSTPGRTTSRTVAKLLRQMFETISSKPAPPELVDLVDQLNGSKPEVDSDPENEPAQRATTLLAMA